MKRVIELSNGFGSDGVIITATDKSNEIISNSAQMTRKRGRIVLVGVIGLSRTEQNFMKRSYLFKFRVVTVPEDMILITKMVD